MSHFPHLLGVLCAMTIGLSSAPATAVETSPFGTWVSPISATDLGSAALGFSALEGRNDALYWLEYRPQEEGRTVIMRRHPNGATETLIPEGFNVRSRVHEYGGGAYAVIGKGVVFSNFKDQRLYWQIARAAPRPITPEDQVRFADCAEDGGQNRLICVREDHRAETIDAHGEARNALVAVSRDDGTQTVLFEGPDFVAYPRLSRDGAKLAWISWNHPNMPWDTVSLHVAPLEEDGTLGTVTTLNEGKKESVLQPTWGPDGQLYFTADRSGYWALYRWDGTTVQNVLERDADLGGPLWSLGQTFFDFLPDGRIVAAYTDEARHRLAIIDPQAGTSTPVDLGPVEVTDPTVAAGRLFALAAFPDRPHAIIEIDPDGPDGPVFTVVRSAGDQLLSPGFIAKPETITYATGPDDKEVAHAIFYPPTNERFVAPEGEKPPLIVMAHGGPTGHRAPTFRLDIQYWTTRGFGVLDINYRGSSGFGRAYRERLYGQWGLVDVEDAVKGARHLAAQGRADAARLLIRGGSAGGYVVLAAMAFHDVFAAGANYYGVSDLEALAKDTHKFESRYLDQLVGPYPERRDLYVERSPIHHLDGFTKPLIVLQGLEDKVVPPNQSEAIVNALREKGIPVAYITFAEEQHGFRKAENRKRALEAELSFYGQILGFTPAGEIDPVDIENLPN